VPLTGRPCRIRAISSLKISSAQANASRSGVSGFAMSRRNTASAANTASTHASRRAAAVAGVVVAVDTAGFPGTGLGLLFY
jgi:hypothetical protein